jgi:hypothetical protein
MFFLTNIDLLERSKNPNRLLLAVATYFNIAVLAAKRILNLKWIIAETLTYKSVESYRTTADSVPLNMTV